ncbi:MAG TPA: hypothetical protein VI958_06065, partial [Acidobacteriota bacterium]
MPGMYEFSNVWNFPVLSVLLYLPLAGAVFLIFFISKEKSNLIRWFANIVAFLDMLISLAMVP